MNDFEGLLCATYGFTFCQWDVKEEVVRNFEYTEQEFNEIEDLFAYLCSNLMSIWQYDVRQLRHFGLDESLHKMSLAERQTFARTNANMPYKTEYVSDMKEFCEHYIKSLSSRKRKANDI